jgi:hypothetical protein
LATAGHLGFARPSKNSDESKHLCQPVDPSRAPSSPRPLSGVSTETLECFLRPCDLIDIKADPRFHQIYRDIWNDLQQEVLKSHEWNR